MKKYWSPLFIGVLLVNMLSGNAAWAAPQRDASRQDIPQIATTHSGIAAPQATDASYTIYLRSRSFTPNEGQAAAGLDAVRRQAQQTAAEKSAAGQNALPGRVHSLVQLYAIPDSTEIERLAGQGITLLGYIPDNTWLAALDTAHLTDIQSMADAGPASGIRWMGALELADKMAPELYQVASQSAAASTQTGSLSSTRPVTSTVSTIQVVPLPGQTSQLQTTTSSGASANLEQSGGAAISGETWLTVRFYDDQSSDAEQALLAQYGARVALASPETHRYDIYLPTTQTMALAAEDTIRWLSYGPPAKRELNNDVRARTGVNTVQAAPYNLSGAGVQAGIWDGGTVDQHIDFNGRLIVVDSGTAAEYHATHVAGTMAGSGVNSVNYSQSSGYWRGMAPGADIISFDWTNATIEHSAAINTYGIDLSQNSWGFTVGNNNCSDYGAYSVDSHDYDQIVTGLYGRRIPVMFAVGNDRDADQCGHSIVAPYLNYNTILNPATAKNVISVGASYADDDAMTDYSDWGPTQDGRLKPEIVAPGGKKTTYQGISGIISTYLDNGYGGMSGTSMATPAISGIVALLIQQYRLTNKADPLPATLKADLIQTAVDLNDSTSYYNYGPDYASGYGRVNAKAAVDQIIAGKLKQDSVSNGQSDSFTVNVPSGTSELKISLAWDDPAAVENASKTLVNNLNLSLKSPGGSTVLPLVLDPANPSATATNGVDTINNIEQVRVSNPAAGSWTVIVTGASVPYGPQSYSLAGADFSNNAPPYVPSAPQPDNASSGLAPGMILTWNGGDPDGESTSYDVYLSKANPPASLVCNANTLPICYTGSLQNGTTYYWNVVAKDARGAQTSGPVWSFTTTPTGVPSVFYKIGPGNTSIGTMVNPTLRWSASSGANSFQYCYATSAAGCTNWTTVSGTSASLTGLMNNTEYYWQVRAVGSSSTTYADGSASNRWTFTTLASIPGATLAKTSPNNNAGALQTSVTLSWSPTAGATSYQYCVDTTDNDACSGWVSVGPATTVTLTGLIPFTTYYWQVRALTANGTVYANNGAGWSFYTGMGNHRLNLPIARK